MQSPQTKLIKGNIDGLDNIKFLNLVKQIKPQTQIKGKSQSGKIFIIHLTDGRLIS